MRIKNTILKKTVAAVLTVTMIFPYGITQAYANETDTALVTQTQIAEDEADAQSAAQAEVHGSVAPVNEKYLEYMGNEDSDDSSLMPSTLDLSYLAQRYEDSMESANDSLPESYDLRDYGLVNAVQDQGSYGTCWTFGALGASESTLMKRQFSSISFSRKHLAWSSETGDEETEFLKSIGWYVDAGPYMTGGNNLVAVASLSAWKGPVYDSVLPYEDFDVEPDESLRYQSAYHLQDALITCDAESSSEKTEAYNNLVKKALMEYGAFEISYAADVYVDEYYNDDYASLNHNDKKTSNHSNVLVGWDDNFSKDYFAEDNKPSNDGAWLLCNSWGTSYGEDGYIWISYEDESIEFYGWLFCFEDNDNYETNYQYDTTGWSFNVAADDFTDSSAASKTAYISNVFTANEDEQLEAVSFYTTDAGTEYEISVYTDVTDGNPVSGKLAYSGQSGKEEYAGYHTIELDNAVPLKEGMQFSVVIKLMNPEYAYPIAAEGMLMDDANAEPQYLGNGGESYYSADGKTWTDIVELGKYAIEGDSSLHTYTSNICIKAFTNSIPESGEAIGNVDFSLLEGEVALGSELKLSGAQDIHYTITPIGGTESEEYSYTGEPIVINEPCTITAWGVSNNKTGNKVSKTYTKQVSRLTDLALKSDGSITHVDLDDTDSTIYLESSSGSVVIKPCGKDTITVNGTEVQSNKWSDEITLTKGSANSITVSTEGEGKETLEYKLRVYYSPLACDYHNETVTFDENAYTVTDEDNNELKSGASVTPYITIEGETPKKLTVTNKTTDEAETVPVKQRVDLSSVGLDYKYETTNVKISGRTYVSDKEDMSDAKAGKGDYYTVIPGKPIYIQRAATDSTFASKVYKIDSPERPETPEAVVEDVGAGCITLSMIDNAEYRIAQDGEWGEWQSDNRFMGLDAETEYELEVRIAATENSFASLAGSAKAKTRAGVEISVKYKAFDHVVGEYKAMIGEGETVYYPDSEVADYGYILSDEDVENGRTVSVKNVDGVLKSDIEEIVFEVSADVTPSDYVYTVNYWTEDGRLLRSCDFTFSHTEETPISEIKIPSGYELAGFATDYMTDNAELAFHDGKWIETVKEVNLEVKRLETSTIRILHTNDIHGYYTYKSGTNIGFAKMKSFADFIAADLILDAGDTYHGQAFATVEKGYSIAMLMKEAGYDAMTLGKLDWNYGSQALKELEEAQGFPILAANVTDADGNAYFNSPYLVKEVTTDDGTRIKVGVVGVIESSFYDGIASDNVKDVVFKEEAATASRIAELLRENEGCDVVIAMTHNSDCEKFVNSISGIDAVIAGYQHKLIDTSYKDMDGKTVYVAEAGYYFRNIGVLSLTYDSTTRSITGAKEDSYDADDLCSFVEDSAVSEKTAELEAGQEEILSKVVGTSSKEYAYSWEDVRLSEQPIGRIITAAYLEYTGADVAFENAGGIRDGIPQGNITYKDIINISPFGNTVVTKELTGRQILALVEYSLELSRQCNEVYKLQKEVMEKGEDPYAYSWPDSNGSVLQFGGITVRYDMSKPQGSRIISAQIKGEDVNPDKKYIAATNNYVAGNTNYPGIAEASILKEYGTCEQALLSYIGKDTFEQAANTVNLSAYVPDGSEARKDDAKEEDIKKDDSEEVIKKDDAEEEIKKDDTKEEDISKDEIKEADEKNITKQDVAEQDSNNQKDTVITADKKSPGTGDDNMIYVYIMLGIMSAAAFAMFSKHAHEK